MGSRRLPTRGGCFIAAITIGSIPVGIDKAARAPYSTTHIVDNLQSAADDSVVSQDRGE